MKWLSWWGVPVLVALALALTSCGANPSDVAAELDAMAQSFQAQIAAVRGELDPAARDAMLADAIAKWNAAAEALIERASAEPTPESISEWVYVALALLGVGAPVAGFKVGRGARVDPAQIAQLVNGNAAARVDT